MSDPISFETIDDLEILRHYLFQFGRVSRWAKPKSNPSIDEKLARLEQARDEALACVEKAIEEARVALIPELTELTKAEGEGISEFDHLLRNLTDLLERECTQAKNTLDACLADPSDPMADFEIDVRIDYCADEHSHGYSENSDNFLTSREYPMRCRYPPESCILRGGEDGGEPNKKSFSRCWLFYNLTEDFQAEWVAGLGGICTLFDSRGYRLVRSPKTD